MDCLILMDSTIHLCRFVDFHLLWKFLAIFSSSDSSDRFFLFSFLHSSNTYVDFQIYPPALECSVLFVCIICCITFWVLHIFISSSSVIISSAVFTFFMNSLRVFHMVFLFVFFLWVPFICKNFICSCLLFTFFTATFNILNIVILKVIILIVLAFCISLGLR